MVNLRLKIAGRKGSINHFRVPVTNGMRKNSRRMGKFHHQLPLSGEIIDAPAGMPGAPAGGRKRDFVEAEFEEIGLPLLTREEISQRGIADSVAARLSGDGMSMLKRESWQKVTQRGSALFYAGAVVIVFMAFWISGGYALFPGFWNGASPQTAAMRLDNITTSTITVNKHPLVLVSGNVVNSGQQRADSPMVKIKVKTRTGDIVSYQLGSKGWPLDPGQSMPFSSRLDAPASGVESVEVGLSEKGKQ